MRRLFSNALASAVLMAGASTTLAAVAVPCSSFNAPYNACVGLTSGNTSIGGANLAFAGDADYSSEYTDGIAAAGSDNSVFDLIDNGDDSFTLRFLQNVGDGSSATLVGLKVVGQGANQVGYFRFDQADFTIGKTLTFWWTPLSAAGHIAHAAVYANTVTPGVDRAALNIPEPATYALMLAGLAAAGAASRRRRPH